MRLSVVSDIHGNLEGLRRAAGDAEVLLVLGDLLDYVDYHDPSQGILGSIFGADRVAELIRLRTVGDFDGFHAYDRLLWASVTEPEAVLNSYVQDRYGAIIEMLGPNTYVTLGNVDVRHLWDAVAPTHLKCLDGEVVSIGGLSFGFVGGGAVKHLPEGSPWKSFDRHPDVFRERLGLLGSVDVLCTHIPPKVRELRFDTVADRTEMYGPGIVEYIDEHAPSRALFGHIHHPLAKEARIGSTLCRNVGYFKLDPEPFTFEI